MQTTIGTSIDTAIDLLNRGEVVAIPTETVYGLAANALNEQAVIKIFETKERPLFNPLIIHVASVGDFKNYVINVPDKCLLLAQKFCPGPITFLLKKKNTIPDIVTAGSDRVAIRIPAHPITLSLLKKINYPLAAPSANVFGYVSPVSAQHVYNGLNGKIAYILDGGDCSVGIESTIIGFDENENIILYRQGGITKEAIENLLNEKVSLEVQHEKPETPGQLKSHYATNTPLVVGNILIEMEKHENKKIAFLSLNKKINNYPSELQFQLSPIGNLNEAAQNLFKTLREIDALQPDVIIAELMPNYGLGNAINDRLLRAQHKYK